ncbi:hypothetical protein [Rhodopirellula halodulae]|uniref:hypothetical protein n=1 Tax=Rhodopirellula halodulae TaxID=2894198 RepID=UPI001E351019|nr:hypothetical protein [Rhodopirellula sp. JC737]MCC9655133.1 hypothetical protein [Rhodopirellula sp. JC737]
MTNPYKTPPEVDDDDLRLKERQRKISLPHLVANFLLLVGTVCSFGGKATAAACTLITAALILIHERFSAAR